MSATIRKTRRGRVIFTAGLRRDGESSFDVASDWRDGGTVIVAFATPWVVIAIFDGPRLDIVADELGIA